MERAMRIGIVGCGFTADQYLTFLRLYPHLRVEAATDRDEQRASTFCAYHSVKRSPSLEAMLADASIELIVNLTRSSSHYAVSKASLEAGKHVYSEKPFADTVSQAKELLELAKANGLYLSVAPCNLLGETAQTLWRALRNRVIGSIRVVYADLDDGPLHLAEPHLWKSTSGAPYDYREDFTVGVTLEHAAYFLSLFTAFFGPAKVITPFSACLWPDRQVTHEQRLNVTTPDFSVACITFESGVVARLTCSLIAPFNHAVQIVGDTGVIKVNECWNYSAPVYLDRFSPLRYRAERYAITKEHPIIKNVLSPRPRIYPPVRKASLRQRNARIRMDYAGGLRPGAGHSRKAPSAASRRSLPACGRADASHPECKPHVLPGSEHI